MFGWFRKGKGLDNAGVVDNVIWDATSYVGYMSGDTRFSVDDYLSDYVKHHVLASHGNGLAKRVLDSVKGKNPKHRDYFVAVDRMNRMESEVRRVLEKYRELR